MQKNIPQLRNLLTVLFLALSLGTVRAQIRGTVVDADDGYGVPYANVMIPATRENIACDGEGNFKLPRGHVTKIVVSSVGYEKQSVVIPAGTDSITVSLKSSDNSLAEVRVKARRKRYHRKDNPAVELMRRVIAKKKVTNLENHDYYRCRKYQKITLSENEVDTVGKNRKPWYLNHLDKSPIDSTKLILPVTINEQITEHLYRKKPRRDLDIVEATRASGVNKIFQTGDMVNTMLKEVFQDVDINNDYIRMLQYPFPSPLGRTAISFFPLLHPGHGQGGPRLVLPCRLLSRQPARLRIQGRALHHQGFRPPRQALHAGDTEEERRQLHRQDAHHAVV